MDHQRARWARMMAMDGAEMTFEVRREVLEPGASFSEPAMDALAQELVTWVGTRVMRRWDATQEPPSVLRVVMTVEVG